MGLQHRAEREGFNQAHLAKLRQILAFCLIHLYFILLRVVENETAETIETPA
jgi:hypothetical protein